MFHGGQLPLYPSCALLRWVLPTGFTTLTRPAIIAPAVIAMPAATTTTKPAAARGLRSRFIYSECTSTGVFTVQRCHGFFCFVIVWHLDETETTGPACITISGNRCAVNGPKRLK